MKNVVIIGQGYVGLPLAQRISEVGIKVNGLELNSSTVDQLNRGHSHVDDISDASVKKMILNGYVATTDYSVVADADAVIICVPTPLGDAGSPDLSAVVSAASMISKNLTPNTVVILESTTYPGTTEDLVLPILEESGLVIDRDFHLAFSPERIDPGNLTFGLRNTPKVVGGVTKKSTKASVGLYSKFIDTVVPVKGSREAETAKLLENTYRHINIALVNEMAKFCHELEIDLWDVIRAAKTKPFGFQAFYPGPGVGGHCIPIDPNYLGFQVKKTLGYPFRFVELAQEINSSMPAYVVGRANDILNAHKKSLNGSIVLLLGVTYKPNISDQRESPAISIANILESKGAIVKFHDPHVDVWTAPNSALTGDKNLNEAVVSADIVMLLQNHDVYDVDFLAVSSKAFLDCKGSTRVIEANRL